MVRLPSVYKRQRIDHEDLVYKTKREKVNAVTDTIVEAHEKGQPVLVGTITIESSEIFSDALKKRGVPHKVLNAKFHELEAEIVACLLYTSRCV